MTFRSRAFEIPTVTIATDLPELGTLRDEQRLLRARLARLRRRLRLQLALEFAVDAAVVLTATAAVLVFLDWWSRFGLPARLALLTASLAAILVFLAVRAVRRWRSWRLDELSLAMILDRFRPGTGQQVADVLQLPDLLDDPTASSSSSPAMVRLAVRRASRGAGRVRLGDRSGTRGGRPPTAAALLVALLVPAPFALAAPDAARLSFARWLLGSNERWPQRTYLTVTGLDGRGRLVAPRDERFTLEVRSDLPGLESARRPVGRPGARRAAGLAAASPRRPSHAAVGGRAGAGGRRGVRDGVMVATGPAQFRYEFPPSPSSSTFDLVGGDDWLGPLRVERVDRPSLAGDQAPGQGGRGRLRPASGTSTTRASTWSSCPTPRSS